MPTATKNGNGSKPHKAAPSKLVPNGTPAKEPTAFGQLVKSMRKAKGISQADLARKATISAGYIGLIETGDRGASPAIEIVKKIAQAVEATVGETEQLLRVSGHLGAGESLFPTGQPESFPEFIRNFKRFTAVQRNTLLGLAESWGLLD